MRTLWSHCRRCWILEVEVLPLRAVGKGKPCETSAFPNWTGVSSNSLEGTLGHGATSSSSWNWRFGIHYFFLFSWSDNS